MAEWVVVWEYLWGSSCSSCLLDVMLLLVALSWYGDPYCPHHTYSHCPLLPGKLQGQGPLWAPLDPGAAASVGDCCYQSPRLLQDWWPSLGWAADVSMVCERGSVLMCYPYRWGESV